ncbi:MULTISPECIES: RNA-guided endonuclease InsQ/TnpB family protein [Methylobacterium]|uniref:RNA-guided endonuclease InsQ/TnpB family protein n=1 Tax=Methylobacterium TaxID=407 RepID=UPI00272EA825|nr:transposase [Methylobacterium sp.]
MILTYQQKLRPTAAQHRLLAKALERQRLLYNAALQERRDAWRLGRKAITRLDQQKSLTVIRADDPEGHGADPVTMGRWTLKRVEDGFTGFFGRVKRGLKPGFPRFKPVSRWNTFGLLEATGLRHEGDRIRLKGFDRPIHLNHDHALPSDAKILGVTFTRKGRHWYVGFTVETTEVVATTTPVGEAVGGDLGVEALLTLSTGERIPNVRPASRREREIPVSRRALARCRKGSNRRRKVKARLARQLRVVANTRDQHLDRVSARLAREHSLVVLEDLRIRNMTRSAAGTVDEPGTNVRQKRGLNRSILEAGWGKLVQFVRYKAIRAGGELICVDARNSSQACRRCKAVAAKPLSLRRHLCPCGLDEHRDVNSAGVLRDRGLAVKAASEGGQPLGDAPRRLRAALENVRWGHQPRMTNDRKHGVQHDAVQGPAVHAVPGSLHKRLDAQPCDQRPGARGLGAFRRRRHGDVDGDRRGRQPVVRIAQGSPYLEGRQPILEVLAQDDVLRLNQRIQVIDPGLPQNHCLLIRSRTCAVLTPSASAAMPLSMYSSPKPPMSLSRKVAEPGPLAVIKPGRCGERTTHSLVSRPVAACFWVR